MTEKDSCFYYKTWLFCLLLVILVMNVTNQNSTIAAIRAVGNQCSVYTIDLEKIKVPDIEEIN